MKSTVLSIYARRDPLEAKVVPENSNIEVKSLTPLRFDARDIPTPDFYMQTAQHF